MEIILPQPDFTKLDVTIKNSRICLNLISFFLNSNICLHEMLINKNRGCVHVSEIGWEELNLKARL